MRHNKSRNSVTLKIRLYNQKMSYQSYQLPILLIWITKRCKLSSREVMTMLWWNKNLPEILFWLFNQVKNLMGRWQNVEFQTRLKQLTKIRLQQFARTWQVQVQPPETWIIPKEWTREETHQIPCDFQEGESYHQSMKLRQPSTDLTLEMNFQKPYRKVIKSTKAPSCHHSKNVKTAQIDSTELIHSNLVNQIVCKKSRRI